jgi:hypothetical protein
MGAVLRRPNLRTLHPLTGGEARPPSRRRGLLAEPARGDSPASSPRRRRSASLPCSAVLQPCGCATSATSAGPHVPRSTGAADRHLVLAWHGRRWAICRSGGREASRNVWESGRVRMLAFSRRPNGSTVGQQLAAVVEQDDAVAKQAPALLRVGGHRVGSFATSLVSWWARGPVGTHHAPRFVCCFNASWSPAGWRTFHAVLAPEPVSTRD